MYQKWLYNKAFPDYAGFVNHIRLTENTFNKIITVAAQDSMDAHRLTIVIYGGAEYSPAQKTINIMPALELPLGSVVERCIDASLYDTISTRGTVWGTAFTIMLPMDTYAWDFMAGKFGHFTSYGYIHMDPLAYCFSSAIPGANDFRFNGYQGQLNGNISGVLGNFNMGWGIFRAFVPKGGYHQILGIFDTGVDTLHDDVNIYRIDTARSYNVLTSNRDIRDFDGHGTRTFSLMSGEANNTNGIVGTDIVDTVQVYKVMATSSGGPMSFVTTATNMAHSNGVTDKNYSLGTFTYDPTFAVAIAMGYSTYNSWSYAASGNTGSLSNTVYPACLPKVWTTVGTLLGGGAWSGGTTTDSAFTGVVSYQVYASVQGTTTSCTPASGTSFGCPQTTGQAAITRALFPDFTYEQTKQLYISFMNGGGSRTPTHGNGVVTDSLVKRAFRKYMLANDTITFAACTGKYRIGALQPRYDWIDSGWAGANPVLATLSTDDSVNSNLIPAGTYVCKRAVGSMPRILGWTTPWRDTINQVVIVNPGSMVTPTITINATPAGSICAGTSVSYTATHTNGGTSPAFQWKVNGVSVGSSIPTHSYAPANGDVVTCTLTSSLACVTTPTVVATMTMTVNPVVVPAVTIVAAPGSTICTGSPVTFTPTPVGGGTPTYQWYKNGVVVSTSPTYASSTLVSGDNVWCVMSSTAPCAMPASVTSNTVTMTVGAPVTPTISVSASPSGTVCAGASVTYTAAITNGGSSPTYQWKVNGVTVGGSTAAHSYAPANGDVITCKLTSSLTCVTTTTVTSTPITATVNPLTPNSVTIAVTPSATICAGTAVTFTPTPIGGGSTPSYQWRVNGTIMGTGTTYSSSSLASSDNVWVTMMSSAPCPTPASVTSNTVTMTVNPIIVPSVTITPTPGSTICAGTPVTFTLASSGGGTPSYSWKLNGTAVGTGTTYASSSLVTGDLVWVAMTSTATCATPATVTSNTVTMTVSAPTTPSSTATPTSGSICSLNLDTITASCSVTGTTVQWQSFSGSWSNISGAVAPIYYTPLLSPGTHQYRAVFTMPAGCFTRAYDTTPVVSITVIGAVPAPTCTVSSGIPFWTGTHYDVIYTASPSGGPYSWYCNGAFAATTPSNTWVHTISALGDTVFAVYKPVGCFVPDTSISNVVRVPNPLGFAEPGVQVNAYAIFPNPVKDLLSIKGAHIDDQVIIENAIGQNVWDSKLDGTTSQQINLSTLTPGMYIFRLFDKQHNLLDVEKFVKKE
ncbi:T9SS type A sorting domain-containing protein [Patescibacteria group bacterium]|nr:T9SS type A sorting domain-containing protein [Patescibacteria group bacterium]